MSGDIINTILRFYVSQYAVCVSEIRIIPIEKSDSRKGSRKVTLFKSTSRNFVMEGFRIFTIFVRCSIWFHFLLHQNEQEFSVPASFFRVQLSFLRLNRRYVTILRNFLTDFLRTSIARGMRRSFPTIRAKFRVSFRKVSADTYTRASVRVVIEG